MIRLASPAELTGLVGQELGVGEWQLVDQRRVDAFAEVTGDRQWIHVDATRAAAGPYGRPLAHGMLTLALVPTMITGVIEVGGSTLIINRAVGRSRFGAPVRAGDRVRGRVVLASARPRPNRFHDACYEVTVEVEGTTDPALRTDMTFLYQGAAV